MIIFLDISTPLNRVRGAVSRYPSENVCIFFQKSSIRVDWWYSDKFEVTNRPHDVMVIGSKKKVSAFLDRQITKGNTISSLGIEQPRDEKKNTDQVIGNAGGESSHGGDGNSGEVEHEAQASQRENAADSEASNGGAGTPGKEETETQKNEGHGESSLTSEQCEPTPDRGDADSEGSSNPHRTTVQCAESINSEENRASGVPSAERQTMSDTESNESTETDAKKSHSNAISPVRKTPNQSGAVVRIGNVTAGLDEDRGLASRIKTSLSRIVNAYQAGATGKKTPRIGSRKLITELVSRRYAINRARKEEAEIRPVLIMCDVSGSCSASAQETLKASLSLVEAMPDLVQLVVHTNGYPREIAGKFFADIPTSKFGYLDSFDTVERLKSWYLQEEWGLVINFGDEDANFILAPISQKAKKLVWLDSYGAKKIGIHPCKEKFPDFKNEVVQKVNGVNDAQTALFALNKLIK